MRWSMVGHKAALGAIMAAAGLMFALSATTSQGQNIREDGVDLASLARRESTELQQRQARVSALQTEVDAKAAEVQDATVNALSATVKSLAPSAGLWAVEGDALRITLQDSQNQGALQDPKNAAKLVVHQQDIEAVMNALWSAGAEAMMVMDQRVVGTSNVRCVGNTLRLQGRTYSPPYTVSAIGNPTKLREALDRSPELQLFRNDARRYGLGYEVEVTPRVVFPAFEGTVHLRSATVVKAKKNPDAQP